MIISPKTESCFFLPDLQEGYQLSINYLVVSSKNGKQQDITMRLRDPKRRLVTYQGRRATGNYSDYSVTEAGDFELCFNNRHSHADSKKVVWQFDIQGDEDVVQRGEEVDLAVNQTLEEYLLEVTQVEQIYCDDTIERHLFTGEKSNYQGERKCGEGEASPVVDWEQGQQNKALTFFYSSILYLQTPKDTERLESVMAMIDTWSMVYSGLVCVVGWAQVTLLKRLFNETPASGHMKMRI